eukprot:tig00000842_g4853.t1
MEDAVDIVTAIAAEPSQGLKERYDETTSALELLSVSAREPEKRKALEAVVPSCSAIFSAAARVASPAGDTVESMLSKLHSISLSHDESNGAAPSASEAALRVATLAARALRNIMAGSAAAQQAFFKSGCLDEAARLIVALSDAARASLQGVAAKAIARAEAAAEAASKASDGEPGSGSGVEQEGAAGGEEAGDGGPDAGHRHRLLVLALRTVLQMLGNAVVENSEGKEKAWAAVHPGPLLAAMQDPVDEVAFSSATMVLYNAARGEKARLEALLAGGAPLLRAALVELHRAGAEAAEREEPAPAEPFEWVFYLLQHLVSEGLLERTYRAMGDGDASGVPSVEQVELLAFVGDVVLHPALAAAPSAAPLPAPGTAFLASLFASLPRMAAVHGPPPAHDDHSLERNGRAWRMLLAMLTEVASVGEAAVQDLLVRSDALPIAVETLVALVKRDASAAAGHGVEPHPHLFALKSDLLRFIAAAAYGHAEAQALVTRLGGFQAVVQCCSIEEHNPQMAECAVLCIRALTDGNEENGKILHAMQEEAAHRRKPGPAR